MRTFVEAYVCTIDSGKPREMVDLPACDGLQAIDTDSEFSNCTRLSIASATPIFRTGKVDGAR